MKKKAFKKQFGVSLIHFTVALLPLLAIGGFAVDFGNALVSQTELQNAADAGALEGARQLYITSQQPNPNVGQCSAPPCTSTCSTDPACDTAAANSAGGVAVEVISTKRGHWTFTTRGEDATVENGIERGGFFTPNNNSKTAPLVDASGKFRPIIDLENFSDPTNLNCSVENQNLAISDINRDTCDINAVEVCVRNTTTTYLAKLLGFSSFNNTACAVAYVGFAGKILPGQVDIPIAMCGKILTEGCEVARLVPENDQTGGWTDFIQPGVTDGTASNCSSAKKNGTLSMPGYGDLVDNLCSGHNNSGNNWELILGSSMQVKNGQDNDVFSDLYTKWKSDCDLDTKDANGDAGTDGWPDNPMTLKMPVVDGCNLTGDCAPLIGAIQTEVIWMFLNTPGTSGANSIDDTAPWSMEDWSSSDDSGIVRWDSFVDHFDLVMTSGDNKIPATYAAGGAKQKTIYFKPKCESLSFGGTGGANYGVRAEIPVLVY